MYKLDRERYFLTQKRNQRFLAVEDARIVTCLIRVYSHVFILVQGALEHNSYKIGRFLVF